MNIGNTIRKLRKEKGMSQKELANLLHFSPDTISLWELNKSLPDAKNIVELCKIFNVSADYLLGLEKI